jgi:rhodanese-related sulfurtransferase
MGKRSPHEATCPRIASGFHQGRTMSSINSISPDKLARLIGVAHCPALIDVRTDEDHESDPRLLPCTLRRRPESVSHWASEFVGRPAIIIDKSGEQDSEGVAGWLRHAGANSADVLTGGHLAWVKAGGPVVPAGEVPPRDPLGRTVWVTRSRPKVDRIACPWLIRRFVDPNAVFLFVAPVEVSAVAERFGGAAFDIEGTFWSHRGQRCTFDTMLEEWGLAIEPYKGLRSSCGERIRRASILPPKPRGCSQRRSANPACMRMISNSSKPGWSSTTPFIAGAAMRPTSPTTGLQQNPEKRREHSHTNYEQRS